MTKRFLFLMTATAYSCFAQAGAAGSLYAVTSATLQSAATANGNGTALSVRGFSTVMYTLNCSSCSGGTTLNFELSEDGTNYFSSKGTQLGTDTIAISTTASGITGWTSQVGGAQSFRVRISGYSAGTVTATATATVADFNPKTTNANQAGTWTVQPGNTANTTAWKMDGSAVTQPVSIAGNQAANVAQINGVTPLMGNGASGTGAQRVTLANDSTGVVSLATGANTIGALTANQSTNTAQINGVTPLMGNGASGTGAQRVTLANDSTGVVSLATGANTIGALAANQSVNAAQINGVAPSMGNGASGTGVQRVTLASDSTGQVAVATLPADPLGANADSAATAGSTGSLSAKLRLMTTQLDSIQTAVQLIDDDQTGASVFYRTAAGTTEDEHEIKATAGRLFSIVITNTNAAARYIRCYNLTAANTTPGTSTVFWGAAIPGATAGAGFSANFGPMGMAFSTALTCAFTTGAADTDVAEVAANEIKATYTYK